MKSKHVLALACLAGMSCGDDAEVGQGRVQVTAYGEAFIEEGIAASEVTDGWTVSFEQFEVDVEDIEVAGRMLDDPSAVDLRQASGGQGQELGTLEAPAGEHGDASFTIASVHVVGSAQKDGETKTFDWHFDERVRYESCETTTEVPEDGVGVFQITVHADHFLYDSLISEDPELTFQALADADTGDGVISAQELAAAGLPVSLDPGSEGIDNLWDWLGALVRTLGHVDGEGHCEARPVE